MTTAFKTVQDALVAALLTPPDIVGPRVAAGRARPMPQEHDSDIAISIENISGEDVTLTSHPKDWSVIYGVEIRARGSATVDAVAALDPLLEAAFARLMQTAPPAGVMGWVLEPRIRVDVEEAGTPVGVMQLALNVRMRTQPASLLLAA
jgi:hypothetical protein